MFVQTSVGMIVCLSIPFIILALLQVVDAKRNQKYIEEKGNKQKIMEEEIERLKKENEELMKKQ